jgi:H+/Cl- antiporter ClcA
MPSADMADPPPPANVSPPAPRAFLVLLALAAAVGVLVSLAAWGFLELIHQIQVGLFTDLPEELGYHHGAPSWFYVVVLGLAGLLTAAAIVRLPGDGGHVPAEGLKIGGDPVQPIQLPGIILAAFATIGGGLVLGPEAPLIALGAGLGVFAIRSLRKDTPAEAQAVMAAAGSIAAMALLFNSPIIAAVILLEALGLDREKLPLILLPGLLAAGIGSLISIGMGSLTGLSTSAYALGTLTLPPLDQPALADFAWTFALAIGVAALTFVVMRLGLLTHVFARRKPFLVLPAVAIVVALLAIVFHEATGRGIEEVLFSGQDALSGLATGAAGWSISALLLLLLLKGLAWGISLGSFRGGPTFPALFIGAAAGVLASHLPGFDLTGAVAVGMGAGAVSVLKLPLSCVVLASLLVSKSGAGSEPLIIVGVVVAYLVTIGLDKALEARQAERTGSAAVAPTQPAPS